MSRIGRKPIPLPPGVSVSIQGSEVVARGSRGELSRVFPSPISFSQSDGILVVSRPDDSRLHKALHGLCRSLLFNMVQGVSQGFVRDLELVGVGYRAQKSGEKVTLQLGLSHPVEFTPPPGITLELDGTTKIRVQGIDKELVGQIAARLRALRPPDAYRGKAAPQAWQSRQGSS